MITRLGVLGSIIDKLNDEYQQGNIEGVVITVVYKNGTTETAWTNLPFYQRIGMVETLKHDMQRKADCEG